MKSAVKKYIVRKLIRTLGDNTKIDDIMAWPLILQKISGLQILDPSWSWRNHFVHFLLNTLIFIYVFFGTLEIKNSNPSSELMAEAAYTLILTFISPIKMVLFIQNRDTFRRLYVMAKTGIYPTIACDSARNAQVFLRNIKRLSNVLTIITLAAFSFHQILTVYRYIIGDRILLSRSTEILLPMTSPYYEFGWVLHSIFMIEVSVVMVILDLWFVFLTYTLCAASDVTLKVLIVSAKEECESDAVYKMNLAKSLRQFYNGHVQLNEYLHILNRMYKYCALVPLLNAAMSICVVLFASSTNINIQFALQYIPLLIEVLAYNWFGELIKTKMNNLRLALINFDWINLCEKDRKSYIIMTIFLKKNFGIEMANGTTLSRITMTSVLKMSYRAFTVLKTMDN